MCVRARACMQYTRGKQRIYAFVINALMEAILTKLDCII